MPTRKPDPRTVAYNLISEHGRQRFQLLIDLFRRGESGTKIGQEFGVTRQRVSQWRSALGVETVSYRLHDEIADLAEDPTTSG